MPETAPIQLPPECEWTSSDDGVTNEDDDDNTNTDDDEDDWKRENNILPFLLDLKTFFVIKKKHKEREE